VAYNQLAESVAETRRVGPSRLPILAADFLLVAVVPSVFGDLLKHALRGDDWDQWDKMGPALAKAQVAYLLGFMVGAARAGHHHHERRQEARRPRRACACSPPTCPTSTVRWSRANGRRLRKALINTAGVLTVHFPAAQLNRTSTGSRPWPRARRTTRSRRCSVHPR
jgi:hypothetical protein